MVLDNPFWNHSVQCVSYDLVVLVFGPTDTVVLILVRSPRPLLLGSSSNS